MFPSPYRQQIYVNETFFIDFNKIAQKSRTPIENFVQLTRRGTRTGKRHAGS